MLWRNLPEIVVQGVGIKEWLGNWASHAQAGHDLTLSYHGIARLLLDVIKLGDRSRSVCGGLQSEHSTNSPYREWVADRGEAGSHHRVDRCPQIPLTEFF